MSSELRYAISSPLGVAEAVVDRGHLAGVLLRDQLVEPTLVAAGDLEAPVGRAVVDDDVLDVGVVLLEDGQDRLLEELRLVVGRA